MMQDVKIRRAFSALILILVVIIYTFYRRNNAGDITVTVGVDDSKIGVAVDSQEPLFISLEEVEDVVYVEDFEAEDYPDCTICANERTGAFVIITTSDTIYVVNTSTKNATKNIYKDIAAALSE